MQLKQGTLLQGGKYKIVRFINAGGFGNTYEALDMLHNRKVAIKEFFMKDSCNRDVTTNSVIVATKVKEGQVNRMKEKFIKEACSLQKMSHPNIVHVENAFEENATAYYVMDYIEGTSLNDIIKVAGSLSEAKALDYIMQIAEALRYVHSKNILHLDIKPGNIMVDKNGKAILIDFGASKQYDEVTGENTSTLLGINTTGYAPAEQSYRGFVKFSASTDIYALGATLYKLLTGITPPDAQMLKDGEAELVPLPSSISTSVKNAVREAMRPLRKDRPQSIQEFLTIMKSNEFVVCEDTDNEVTVSVDVEQKHREEEAEEEILSIEKDDKTENKSSLWKGCTGLAVALVAICAVAYWQFSDTPKEIVENTPKEIAEKAIIYDANNNCIVFGTNQYKMVYVEGGTFKMGSNDSGAFGNEKPVHNVTISDYYIGQTEVTQALWTAVMGSNPSYFKGDNLPVENVTWDDCQDFIKKLNARTGRTFRLPTEAEWEYAARGGKKSKGYTYSGSNTIGDVAWYEDNSGGKTHPVKTKSPNELGIYDMSGNVWEWCQDWYDLYSSGAVTNPTGARSGSTRVFRGGSCAFNAPNCSFFSRLASDPASCFGFFPLGFRLALSPSR